MLDIYPHISPLERRRRRAYKCLISGAQFAYAHHQKLFFLTLTSSSLSTFRSLNECFGLLVKRFRRRFGLFEYCYVRTNEGYGVLHILCKVTVNMLSKTVLKWLHFHWEQLRHAKQLKVVRAYGSFQKLSGYLVNYITGNLIIHFFSSRLWIFKGWLNVFKKYVCSKNFQSGLRRWVDFIWKFDTKGLYSDAYSLQLSLDKLSYRRPKREYLFKIGLPKWSVFKCLM